MLSQDSSTPNHHGINVKEKVENLEFEPTLFIFCYFIHAHCFINSLLYIYFLQIKSKWITLVPPSTCKIPILLKRRTQPKIRWNSDSKFHIFSFVSFSQNKELFIYKYLFIALDFSSSKGKEEKRGRAALHEKIE